MADEPPAGCLLGACVCGGVLGARRGAAFVLRPRNSRFGTQACGLSGRPGPAGAAGAGVGVGLDGENVVDMLVPGKPNVWAREYEKATVELDCATFTPAFRLKAMAND